MNDPNSELGRFPASLRKRITSELDSGERIAWVGRPHARAYVIPTIALLVFSVPFTVAAVLWMLVAAGFEVPGFEIHPNNLSPWFGLPFLAIGVLLDCTPFWAVWIAHRTGYVLTDRRAIIFNGMYTGTVHTFLPDRLRNLTRKERRDGSGDLLFLRPTWIDDDERVGEDRTAERGFEAIPDVKQVEDLVRRLVEAHGRDRP